MIAQNEINFLGELAKKTDNSTVSDKHHKRRFKHKTNNGDCKIIRYPRVGVKHSWQVYVTTEPK